MRRLIITLATGLFAAYSFLQLTPYVWAENEKATYANNTQLRPVPAEMNLQAGWSMISLPVIPDNASVSSLFPDAVVVYGYENGMGYVRLKEEEDLEVGKGYWILLNEEKSYTITGQPVLYYIHTVDEDGWAMIGGCRSTAGASSDGCDIGVIYGYEPEVGYRRILESEFLEPCKGYWILLNNVSDQATLRVGTDTDVEKWDLWKGGTRLRGANIYQRRVYPELDGPEFMGPGPVGPPYTQEDFRRLAAMGANYVNISHPGLFTEAPPYVLDPNIQENLDQLLEMIKMADMFAVISFRTGPGRSEFTFFLDEVGNWFDASYLNDSVWQDSSAQAAWAEMWRYTASRYRDNPIVVGYDLMVEPNVDEAVLTIWDPDEFYPAYENTIYDWNRFFPNIIAAIRGVDSKTPILVGGQGYSAVPWLPYLQPIDDPCTVYTIHQYAPIEYTFQWHDSIENVYPGVFDADWDGIDDLVNQTWLDQLLSTVDTYMATHGTRVAANEFGVMRWEPGAADFMDDQIALFEERGINYALWAWDPSWAPLVEEVNEFNFRHGPDPENHQDVSSSPLMEVILKYWERNTLRPSNITRLP